MSHIPTLSIDQAQKIVVLQNKLHFSKAGLKGAVAALQSIQQMGYIQIDSISVIARAHHHSLYNRVRGYQESQLDELLKNKSIFEYWSHAAAYLPMRDYKYSLVRKNAIKQGEMHWFKKDLKMMNEVLAQVRDRGPLMAKDFAHKRENVQGWWDWKPAKVALEQLFMQGDLMVSERRGFQKVYDLTQRVLPNDIDQELPTQEEYCRYLICHYLQAQGLAKASQFGYLLKGIKGPIKQQLDVLLEQGEIIQLQVAGELYYALSGAEQLLLSKLPRQKVKILSPFDNLLIQRKRAQELFSFNYQIECYVPEAKRRFGYFSLPVLQGGSLVAQMDIKTHRKEGLMCINHLHCHRKNTEQLLEPLIQAVMDFMVFNQMQVVSISRVTDYQEHDDKALLSKLKSLIIASQR